jgi:hypothetical protein
MYRWECRLCADGLGFLNRVYWDALLAHGCLAVWAFLYLLFKIPILIIELH